MRKSLREQTKGAKTMITRRLGSSERQPHRSHPSPPPPATAGDEPNLDELLEKLTARELQLSCRIEQSTKELRRLKREMKNARPDSKAYCTYRRRALQVLRQKKGLEKRLELTMNQSYNITEIVTARDLATEGPEYLEVLRQNAVALRKAREDVGTVADMDTLNDDLQETFDHVNDVSNALAAPLDTGVYYDDEDLERELEAFRMNDTAHNQNDSVGGGAGMLEVLPETPAVHPPRPAASSKLDAMRLAKNYTPVRMPKKSDRGPQ